MKTAYSFQISIVIPFLSDGSEASENIHAFLQQYSSTTFILSPNAKCYGILRYRLRKEFVSCRTSFFVGQARGNQRTNLVYRIWAAKINFTYSSLLPTINSRPGSFGLYNKIGAKYSIF